jgi:miniconductance mechanosensitive channel
MEIIAKNLNNLIFICSFILFLVILYFFTKRFFFIFLRKLSIDNNLINNILQKNRVFIYLFYLIPVPILYFLSFLFINNVQTIIQKLVLIYTYITFILILQEILDIIHQIYDSYDISKQKPIKVFIQMGKIIITIIGFIGILSVLFNTSFLTLISGLGALTAILMLVFRDSLLSFKAGIQLITNDMLRIDDWVEIPKYSADGEVIEIALDTIKVRNWDKTITFIPTYKLMEDSFKNWRGMIETRARRIARSILIDQHSIRFLKKEEINYLKKIEIIKEYLIEKEKEMEEKNYDKNMYLTNIGTFRMYILNFLKNNENVINNNEDLPLMVRQLEPTPYGVPLQIYAFIKAIKLLEYEKVQSDIFDHILAMMPEFDIRLYQVISNIKK